MWEKIVLNLISNAFKFTFEGKISIGLRLAGSDVELRVRDTGVGIPARELPRLFDRFHRIENTRSRTHEGSGIGLALVQELVKLHGGKVRVESILGEGSTFIVSLPRGRAHLPAERIGGNRTLASTALGAAPFVEEALRWLPDSEYQEAAEEILPGDELLPVPCPPVSSGEGANAGRPLVLVADDNADMRQYLVRLLSERYEVKAVPDGEAALAAVRERAPSLILSDVMMPNLDGFGLLRALRSDSELRTVPIILLSARAGEESRVEGMQEGADDYLIKPFSARELLARVQTHLEMARVRREAGEALRLSEERARNIVESIADGFIILDRKWRITYVNPRALEIVQPLRKTREGLEGKVFWDEFPGTVGTIFEDSYRRAMAEQVTVGFESFYPPLERWFDVRAYPSRDGISLYFLDVTERKLAEGTLAAERNVLEQIAIGAPLPEVLETLARDTEAQSTDGMLCSVLLFDEGRQKLVHGAAPSLPQSYNDAIHGIAIGPNVGSCGTAAYYRKSVLVENIACDPLWADFKELALTHGLAACCSTPVFSSKGSLLGTVAMYYRRPHTPSAHDRQIIGRATQLAAIAIERKQDAEALRRRTEQFETLLSEAPVGVYLVDADFRLRAMNPAAQRAFGSPGDLVGRDFDEWIHGRWPRDGADEILGKFRHTLETGAPHVEPEWSRTQLDLGVKTFYEWQINRIALPDGRYGVVCYFRDISQQVRVREAIAESEQRLRLATQAAELGIWQWYPEGDRANWENDRVYEVYGRTREDGPLSAAEFLTKVVHAEDAPALQATLARSLETGARFFFQCRIQRKDGASRWVELTAQVERGADGNPLRLLGTVLDITALKQTEESYRTLAETLDAEVRARTSELEQRNIEVLKQSEQLRDLSSRLLQAQDEERRRIARELHDSAGQLLAALGMNLARLTQRIQQNAPQLAKDSDDSQQLVQQLSQEIRTMSYLLHPPLLDEVGLAEAIRWYTQGLTERSHLDVRLTIPEDFPRLPRDMELVMFRLVQECLTNIHRHSGSKSAEIQISRDGENVCLEVQDEGKGISAEKLSAIQLHGSGVGIRGMRERVRQFEGKMDIRSNGEGTRISFVLPLHNAPSPGEGVIQQLELTG
jgi:PAS domain S-box-containing protein